MQSKIKYDIVVMVQGDEPMMNPEDISKVLEAALESPDHIYNGMCPILSEEEFRSKSVPKILSAPDGRLLYATRAPAPGNKEGTFQGAYKQVCVYSFSRSCLDAFTAQQEKTRLEQIEDIEILRFFDLNEKIKMIKLNSNSVAVDEIADVKKAEKILLNYK